MRVLCLALVLTGWAGYAQSGRARHENPSKEPVYEQPLMKAREYLSLALQKAKSGKYSDTALLLRNTARVLKDYKPKPGEGDTIADLRRDVSAYANQIESYHGGAEFKIRDWWGMVDDLIMPPKTEKPEKRVPGAK